MGENNMEEAMTTEAPLAPVTAERKVKSDLEHTIPKPYLARAFAAPDCEHPDGTPGLENHGMTVLQQHVSYFDQDKDGIIYPWNTFRGLRALGLNMLISWMMTFIVSITLSFFTAPNVRIILQEYGQEGWLPFPSLPIYIKRIHKAKHGSDTGTYDNEGRFVPVNFENIFSKYALMDPDKLTLRELWNMTEGYRVAVDFFGGFATKGEWWLVYIIARDKEGFVSKEAVRGIFDGSFFAFVAKKRMTEMADNNSKNISVKMRWCV